MTWPLEQAHVLHQLTGHLPAGAGRVGGGPDPAQQRGGGWSGEVAASACGLELGQELMQPVEGLGAGMDQVVASVRQQPQDGCC